MMPYLNKPKKKRQRDSRGDRRQARVRIYCTEKWKRIRIGCLLEHPLCELCEARGITTLAEDVHHRSSFQLYDGAMKLYKAYDSNNLMSLCKACHAWIHRHGAVRDTDIEAEAEAADRAFGPGIVPHKYI